MDGSLRLLSLAQVEEHYRNGWISEADRDEYIAAWNAHPGRFTVAEWRDGAIRQADKERGFAGGCKRCRRVVCACATVGKLEPEVQHGR